MYIKIYSKFMPEYTRTMYPYWIIKQNNDT